MNATPRQKERDYLEVFQDITRLISMVHDPQQVMDLVVGRLPGLLEVDAATIRLLDRATNTFVLGAAHGVSDEYLSRATIDSREVMAALLAGRPTARTELDRICDHDSCSSISREGVKSAMSLPIVYKTRVIGLLRLLTKDIRRFSEGEIAFAMSLAEQVGLVIANGRMFQELENQERFLHTILDSLWLELLVVAPDKRVILVNRRFLENNGTTEAETLGRIYQEISPWRDADPANCPITKVLAGGGPMTVLARRDKEDGSSWYERHLAPIIAGDGRIDFVLEAIRDVTSQKLLDQEKMARMKLEGVIEMAGTAAHNLNSPLFAALGTAQLLRDDLAAPEQLGEIDTIISNLQKMAALTKEMTAATGFESRVYVGNTKIVALKTGDH